MGGLIGPRKVMNRANFLSASKLTGIQGGINEGTSILFYDKRQPAYICGSDKAIAGDVNRFATFSDFSYRTGER
jgi:hypothetical protein